MLQLNIREVRQKPNAVELKTVTFTLVIIET